MNNTDFIFTSNLCNEIFLSDNRVTTGPLDIKVNVGYWVDDLFSPDGKKVNKRIKNTKQKK